MPSGTKVTVEAPSKTRVIATFASGRVVVSETTAKKATVETTVNGRVSVPITLATQPRIVLDRVASIVVRATPLQRPRVLVTIGSPRPTLPGGGSPVADGTYTVGLGVTQNGTITVVDGIITAVQPALP